MALHKRQAVWGIRTKHTGDPAPGRGGLLRELWGCLKEDFLEGKGLN